MGEWMAASGRSTRLLVVAACVAACIAAVPAAARAAGADNWANAPTLDLFTGGSTTNLQSFGDEDGEWLSSAGPGFCHETSAAMTRTAWFKLPGNGRRLAVSAHGGVEYMLAVYSGSPFADPAPLVDCAYDATWQHGDAAVIFQSQANKTYWVQVGICQWYFPDPDPIGWCNWPGSPDGVEDGTTTPNALVLAVSDPPPYDIRAKAASILPNQMYDNHGAKIENEINSCSGHPYGATVWFKWTAPTWGTAQFTLNGMTGYVSIRRAGSDAVVNCGNGSAQARVSKGETVFVQVGTPQLAEGLFNEGHFTIAADVLNPDDDNDGEPNGGDCAPLDGGRFHGNPEIPGNGVDENCDPSDDNEDKDPVARGDCDDHDPARYPGNHEIRGNGHDEDCIDGDAPPLKPPTTAGFFISDGRLSIFQLNEVVKGSRVVVRCKGRGCARSKQVVSRGVPRAKKHLLLPRRILASFAAGTRIRVEVTNRPEWIGRRFQWRLHAHSAPTFTGYCTRASGGWKTC